MRRLLCSLFSHWDKETEIVYEDGWWSYERCRICGERAWMPG